MPLGIGIPSYITRSTRYLQISSERVKCGLAGNHNVVQFIATGLLSLPYKLLSISSEAERRGLGW